MRTGTLSYCGGAVELRWKMGSRKSPTKPEAKGRYLAEWVVFVGLVRPVIGDQFRRDIDLPRDTNIAAIMYSP